MIVLRPALLQEVQALTELCLRSKAVWGYDEAFMNACRAELTITADDFDRSALCVAVDNETIAGLAQLGLNGDDAQLQKLFIAPGMIRAGAGRQLFHWSITSARKHGAKRLWIESDPGAAGFYRRMGAIDDGDIPSGSIPGRFLPRLRLDI